MNICCITPVKIVTQRTAIFIFPRFIHHMAQFRPTVAIAAYAQQYIFNVHLSKSLFLLFVFYHLSSLLLIFIIEENYISKIAIETIRRKIISDAIWRSDRGGKTSAPDASVSILFPVSFRLSSGIRGGTNLNRNGAAYAEPRVFARPPFICDARRAISRSEYIRSPRVKTSPPIFLGRRRFCRTRFALTSRLLIAFTASIFI